MVMVMAYLDVEHVWAGDVVVDYFDINASFRSIGKVLAELFQFWSANTVGTVNGHTAFNFLMFHCTLEGIGQFFIIPDLSGLSIFRFGSLGVHAADHVVELRSCEEAIVLVLGAGCLQAIDECRDQSRSRGTRVSSKYDRSSGFTKVETIVFYQVIVNLPYCFLIGSICKFCGM